jgi:hypothetical protein
MAVVEIRAVTASPTDPGDHHPFEASEHSLDPLEGDPHLGVERRTGFDRCHQSSD